MALQRQPIVELINVHRVKGDKDAIIFLKNADHDIVEGLFYQAKRYGKATFLFRDLNYDITRQKDFSFIIQVSDEQAISTEQFS